MFFVNQVETLDRDQLFAIHQLGLTGKIKPRWRHSSSGSPNTDIDPAAVYFSQLTKNHVRKLEEKFRLDLELFDYSVEHYYNLATATT